MAETRTSAENPAFQRAFVAVSYFAGTRGAALLAAFEKPTRESQALVQRLGVEDRAERAAALARELERIAVRLEELRLFR